ncbi:hypothetical protein [Olsenella intestinalis]|uniref:hypothetical protein n=1 Tax=Olsenella intestinalis TaxID=2930083 RepID=UPI00200C5DB4|nr:hypothetical protein [Olsenella intestinalis]
MSAATYRKGYTLAIAKRARNEQLKSVHPDRAGTEAEDIAKEVNAALDYLNKLFQDSGEERFIPEGLYENPAEEDTFEKDSAESNTVDNGEAAEPEGDEADAGDYEHEAPQAQEEQPRPGCIKRVLAAVATIVVLLLFVEGILTIGCSAIRFFRQQDIGADSISNLPGTYQQSSFSNSTGLCLTSLNVTSADASTGRISFDYVATESTVSGINGASFSGTINCAPSDKATSHGKELVITGDGTSSAYENASAKFEGSVTIEGDTPLINGKLTVDTTFHDVATQEKVSVSASKTQ